MTPIPLRFRDALQRAAAALEEAAALWGSAPATVDALTADTPYPASLGSLDDVAADFRLWADAVADRVPDGPPLRLLRRLTGPAAHAAAQTAPPFGPGWPPATTDTLTALEIWGTTAEAPEDFCEWRGFRGDTLVAVARCAGF